MRLALAGARAGGWSAPARPCSHFDNLFNSDAPLAYNKTYTATRLPDGTFVADNPATPAVEVQDWKRTTTITNPRFERFSLTFDF